MKHVKNRHYTSITVLHAPANNNAPCFSRVELHTLIDFHISGMMRRALAHPPAPKGLPGDPARLAMKQVQRALRERNECTRAPPIIMPVSRELNSRAHDLHIANNAQCHWHNSTIAFSML